MRCRFCRKSQLLCQSQSRHKRWHSCTFCIQSTFDLLWVSIPWVHREGNPPSRQDRIPFNACCWVNCERSWTKENYCLDTYSSFCWAQHPILMFLWLTKADPPASEEDRISDEVRSWKTDGRKQMWRFNSSSSWAVEITLNITGSVLRGWRKYLILFKLDFFQLCQAPGRM